MAEPEVVAAPIDPLVRVGRAPDPLAFPPWELARGQGQSGYPNRFDAPAGQYRCIYAASERAAAFAECLAYLRPSATVLVALAAMPDGDEGFPDPVADAGQVPSDWYGTRLIGTLRVTDPRRFLDVEAPGTIRFLRPLLAPIWSELGLPDLDVAAIRLGGEANRRLTQAIGAFAFDYGLSGVRYHSRLKTEWECWCIFEGTRFEPASDSRLIGRTDPDLRAAAAYLGLHL